MRKLITAGLAALTLGGSLAATALPAAAAPHGSHGGGGWHGGGGGHSSGGGWHGGGGGGWHGGGGGWHGGGGGWHGGGFHHGDDDDWGWGLGAGLAGFALGAAFADRPYYYDYSPGYYYDDGYYGTCVGHRRVWDPYVGHYIIRRFYYAC